jgi:gliding motility-associated-like protein
VQNPGFESVSAAPTGENQLNLASPWLPLNASPDLFYRGQTSAIPCDNVGIPSNAGGFCEERNLQNAYAGIQIDFSNSYREYLSVPLSVPLISGEIYRIEFYIQLADSSRFSFSRMGALLTNNVPIQPGTGVLNFPPALEWTGNVTDTSGWTYVTGLYQALGGENYLTIGLFRNDGDPGMLITDFGTTFTGCTNFDNSAYYYIDDVSVKPVSESVVIGGDTVLCPGETITLIANSNVPFWWSDGSAPNDTLSLNSLLDINPVAPTWYYLNGLTTRDSVLVTIVNPPVFTLGPDTAVCQDDSLLADATESTALSYLWSTGDSTASIYIYEPGQYYVEVANLGCVRTDTLEVGGFLDNPPLSLGEDSLYCFFFKDTLYLDGGPGASWLWSPTGDTTRYITILQPDTYYVSVIRDNGCRRTASLEVNEACEPLVFIPNAFTPDGDGLNDVIGASVNNADNYSLRIVNRRGQTVFYTDVPGEGWDGKFEGKDAPIGVYIYRLNYHGLDFEGSKYNGKQLGSITLIR